jgi:hypothetical protein
MLILCAQKAHSKHCTMRIYQHGFKGTEGGESPSLLPRGMRSLDPTKMSLKGLHSFGDASESHCSVWTMI